MRCRAIEAHSSHVGNVKFDRAEMPLHFFRKHKEDRMDKPVGKTKGMGFQLGLQKIFIASEQMVWDFMFSDTGLKIWLGDLKTNFSLKENYKTKSEIEGFVHVFKPYSHVRMSWKKKEHFVKRLLQRVGHLRSIP